MLVILFSLQSIFQDHSISIHQLICEFIDILAVIAKRKFTLMKCIVLCSKGIDKSLFRVDSLVPLILCNLSDPESEHPDLRTTLQLV